MALEYRSNDMSDNTKKGSITIEGVIAFTVFLIFITYIVNVVVIYRTEIELQRALTKTCDDFSVLTPLTVTASDIMSTVVNSAPEEVGHIANSTLADIASVAIGFDIATGKSLTSAVLDITLSQRFADDIAAEYISCNGSDFFCPSAIDIDFEVDGNHSIIFVIMNYDIDTIVGTVSRTIEAGIPFYGDMELFLYGTEDIHEEQEEDIWSMSNFDRGSWVINNYGGNLPSTFPVINRYEDGTAESITSINTFSVKYNNLNNFDLRIRDEIDNLAGFNGADVVITGDRYTLSPDDIERRVLTIVIPSNSDEVYVDRLSSYEEYANSHGVTLNIEQYGSV